jgi:hypothetical protein
MIEFYIQVFNTVVYVKHCQLANTQWADLARDGKTFQFVINLKLFRSKIIFRCTLMIEFYIQVFNSVVYVKLCQLANTQWVEIARDGKTFMSVIHLKLFIENNSDAH